jgi:Ca-activated chloride channel homolog
MMLLQEHYQLITTQFHWLRPWWLAALIPIVLLSIFLWRQKRQAHQWQSLIAPELLPFLIDGKTIATKKSLLWGLFFAWVLSAIALAGPSWLKRPTPVEKNQSALVILLDLSISMFSEDIKPSRIARARLKIADIIRERKDGQTALVVYAGEAHTVTPISDDSGTILSLLPSLSPNIMPLQGSNTEAAIERAIKLLQDTGATEGDILLLTDGVVPEAFSSICELLASKKISLHILGVGTNQPAPISSGNGGFLRDKQGAIITTQLNSNELKQLAQQTAGRYSDITTTNSDIELLMPQTTTDEKTKPTLERDFDQWFDQGRWLVFLVLPIILVSFRRGFILMLICIPLIGLSPAPVYAMGLDDIWLTKDQQAQRALNTGDAKKAAEQFKSPDWKAAAQYRAGDYAGAAEAFAKNDSAPAHYNRGNALAKLEKLEDSIKAYNEALKRDPNLEGAKKNRNLVEEILKQKKEQKKQEQQDKNKNDQNKDSDKDSEKKESENNEKNEKNEKQDQENSKEKESQQTSAGADAQASASSASAKAQQAAQASSTPDKDADQKTQQAALDSSDLTEEQKQALEQWLRRVPDDPGGLLRNKFRWQYQQNRQKKATGEFEAPKNNADQRW